MTARTLSVCIAVCVVAWSPDLKVRGASASAQQGATFRARADAVTRIVHVRDALGRFVPGLTKEDFTVFEDGVEQRIDVFAVTSGSRVITDVRPPPPPSATGLILPPSAADPDAGRLIVVFIDDLHLQALDTPRVRHFLELVRDELLQEDDLIAVVSTGYSGIEQNLTRDPDHARFNQIIRRVMGGQTRPEVLIGQPVTSAGPAGVRFDAHTAFKTAYLLLEQLEGIRGRRKAFAYVSAGYDFDPFTESRWKAERERWALPGQPGNPTLANPFDRTGQQFSDADLVAELGELARAANRANAQFYTFDPRGLDAGPPIDLNLSAEEWQRHLRTTLGSLQVLAAETGGRAAVNTNDLRGALRTMNDDLSDYYAIGYTSSNSDPLHRTRTVEIRVSRPGLTLDYTRTYSLRPGR
jgi:VWFA-related protein